MKVLIRCGKDSHTVEIPVGAKVMDLQDAIEPLTGIMVRKQKVIFKGKLLAGTATLSQVGIADGAKLMLMASTGAGTQGQAAAESVVQQKTAAAKARAEQFQNTQRRNGQQTPVSSSSSMQERVANWGKTGVVSLLNEGLSSLPEQLWALGGVARVADLSGNRLSALPDAVAALSGLKALRLAGNRLTAKGTPWTALTSLLKLTILILDNNPLGEVGDAVGDIKQLQTLSLSACHIAKLPESLGRLQHLEILIISSNSLQHLPGSLGSCQNLVHIDAGNNKLVGLPECLKQLAKLQKLTLDNNMLQSISPHILKECPSLALLSVHNNPLTAEQLRVCEGFAELNARRLAKCNKQLEMSVLSGGRTFDEGADTIEWDRFI